MKAAVVSSFSAPLEILDRTVPEPGPGIPSTPQKSILSRPSRHWEVPMSLSYSRRLRRSSSTD